MATEVIEKQKNRLGDMVKSFKKYYGLFILSVVLLLTSVVFSILTPGKIRELTNCLNPIGCGATFQVDFVKVTELAVTLVIFIALSFLTASVSGYILNTIIQKYSRDLRRDIIKKINKLPLNYFDTKQVGDILSVITNDVDTLSTSLQNSVSMLIQAFTMLTGVIIAMFLACWQMAIAVLCSLPLMLFIIFLTFKFGTPLFNKTQKVLGEVNSIVEENFSGQIVIKAFGAEERKINEFKECNSILGKFLFRSQTLGGIIEPFMSLVSYLTYAAILIIGGLLYKKGTINDIGVITGFLVYVALFQQPLAEIGQIGSTIQLGVASCNRVFTFLGEEELPDESYKAPESTGRN